MPSIVEKGIVLVVFDDGEHDDPLQDVCGPGCTVTSSNGLLVTVLTGMDARASGAERRRMG